MKAILGIKKGQSFVFSSDGKRIPITIIHTPTNYITKILTKDKDGYDGYQISTYDQKENKINRSKLLKFKKINLKPQKFSKEFRGKINKNVGDALNISEVFKEYEYVDVVGYSKGKGFSGSIKRHNYSRGPSAHGSGYHRGSGSMGAITANRVFKGKKLPGRMGNEKVSIQNLCVLNINNEENYIFIKGLVPGPKNNLICVKASIKNSNKIVKNINIVYNTKSDKTVE